MKPKLSFTINRPKWRSGGSGVNQSGKGITLLENESGYRCCLGFACLAAGFTRKDIEDHSEPGFIKLKRPPNPKKQLLIDSTGNSPFSNHAIEINDDTELTREQREEQLIKLGKQYNIQIKFKGSYV